MGHSEGVQFTFSKKTFRYPVPEAAFDEILIEKTPDYSGGGQSALKDRAEFMKKTMGEDTKIIVFLCDPALRANSHITMDKRRGTEQGFTKNWGTSNATEGT